MTKLYNELADWWPLMSAPADYAEEAAFYFDAMTNVSTAPIETMLELGAGGGNNASHMKHRVKKLVLTDLSDGMLEHSRSLNPECEHHVGDMRTVRLNRQFDAVFVHDAISYLTSEPDVARADRDRVCALPSRWRRAVCAGSHSRELQGWHGLRRA